MHVSAPEQWQGYDGSAQLRFKKKKETLTVIGRDAVWCKHLQMTFKKQQMQSDTMETGLSLHTHTHTLFTSLLVSPSSTWYLLDRCRLIWIVWPDVRWNVASVFLLSCGFMSLYQYMLSWQDMTQLFLWYNLRSTNQFNTQTDSQTCRFGSSEDKLWQKYLKYWHIVPIKNQFCHLQTGFKQQLGLKRMNVLFPPVEKSNRSWWHSCLLNQNAKRRGMLFCLFFFFFFF